MASTKISKAKIETIRYFLRSSMSDDDNKMHVCDEVYGKEYWHGYRVGIQQVLEALLELGKVDYNPQTDKIEIQKYRIFMAHNLPVKEM